jgi:hypothetical protein
MVSMVMLAGMRAISVDARHRLTGFCAIAGDSDRTMRWQQAFSRSNVTDS